MSEYISKNALMRDLRESLIFSVRDGVIGGEIRGANKVIDRIKAAPTADVVEVRHGEWEKWRRRLFGWDHRCSECKKDAEKGNSGCYDVLTPYCKYCGAKMDR